MNVNEIMLLKVIHCNANTSILRNMGLTYSQIALLIDTLQSRGDIILNDDGLSLTSKGLEVLMENTNKIMGSKGGKWIMPQKYFYNEPISFDTIFLPKRLGV